MVADIKEMMEQFLLVICGLSSLSLYSQRQIWDSDEFHGFDVAVTMV